MFSLDTNSPMPIYAQIEQAIKLALISERLQVGKQMPTVRQLAVDLKVNANTVARVYSELERQGILETRRGIGTFVAAQKATSKQNEKTRREFLNQVAAKFLEETAAAGYSAEEIIEAIKELASRGIIAG